jgi:hypothetical protein
VSAVVAYDRARDREFLAARRRLDRCAWELTKNGRPIPVTSRSAMSREEASARLDSLTNELANIVEAGGRRGNARGE